LKYAYEGINFTTDLKPKYLKNLIFVYYFFRSLLLRGPFATLRLVLSEFNYEKKFGISTMALKRNDSKQFFHYQPASYQVLMKIFPELLGQTAGLDFIDIGCGKGRAVFVAEYCGYKQLKGIELDEDLVTDARENSRHYSFLKKGSEIQFVCANALEYDYQNKPSVYFFFNPFHEEIIRKVLERILAATTSETWFVYMNPMYPLPFSERNMRLVKKIKTNFYTEALVFKVDPGTR
jgi:SAM-dependent methyltransferase